MLTTTDLDTLQAQYPDDTGVQELIRVYRIVLAAPVINGDTGSFRDIYDDLGLDYGDGDVRLVIP